MYLPQGGSSTLTFFFFQAEDGIRDIGVTGVQTCALPILSRGWRSKRICWTSRSSIRAGEKRSEERRVGKSVDLGGGRIIKKKKFNQTEGICGELRDIGTVGYKR